MKATVRDRDAAEVVTAATVATAFEKMRQFRGDGAFDSWVHSIGRRMAYNYRNGSRTGSTLLTARSQLELSSESNSLPPAMLAPLGG